MKNTLRTLILASLLSLGALTGCQEKKDGTDTEKQTDTGTETGAETETDTGTETETDTGADTGSEAEEGWSEDVQEFMMDLFGELLPYAPLDEETLYFDFDDVDSVFYIGDDNETNIFETLDYASALTADGFVQEEDYPDWYDKTMESGVFVELTFDFYEADEDTPAGNEITAYVTFPPELLDEFPAEDVISFFGEFDVTVPAADLPAYTSKEEIVFELDETYAEYGMLYVYADYLDESTDPTDVTAYVDLLKTKNWTVVAEDDGDYILQYADTSAFVNIMDSTEDYVGFGFFIDEEEPGGDETETESEIELVSFPSEDAAAAIKAVLNIDITIPDMPDAVSFKVIDNLGTKVQIQAFYSTAAEVTAAKTAYVTALGTAEWKENGEDEYGDMHYTDKDELLDICPWESSNSGYKLVLDIYDNSAVVSAEGTLTEVLAALKTNFIDKYELSTALTGDLFGESELLKVNANWESAEAYKSYGIYQYQFGFYFPMAAYPTAFNAAMTAFNSNLAAAGFKEATFSAMQEATGLYNPTTHEFIEFESSIYYGDSARTSLVQYAYVYHIENATFQAAIEGTIEAE